jgi:uncharacterized protein
MKDIQKLFTCTRCGDCCHGNTTVSLDAHDLKNMSRALNLSEDETFRKYLRKEQNQIQMKVVGGHCIFYHKGCKVHRGRPHLCAQWPLHPSILLDEANFMAIKSSCPGMSRDISYEEFCTELRRVLLED